MIKLLLSLLLLLLSLLLAAKISLARSIAACVLVDPGAAVRVRVRFEVLESLCLFVLFLFVPPVGFVRPVVLSTDRVCSTQVKHNSSPLSLSGLKAQSPQWSGFLQPMQ